MAEKDLSAHYQTDTIALYLSDNGQKVSLGERDNDNLSEV